MRGSRLDPNAHENDGTGWWAECVIVLYDYAGLGLVWNEGEMSIGGTITCV